MLDGLARAQQEADGGRRQGRRDRPRAGRPAPSPSTTPTSTSRRRALDRPGVEAFLGQEPGEDLSRLIDGTASTAGALIRHEEQLKDLITTSTARRRRSPSESDNLSASIRAAGADARERQRHVRSLNAAFPPTRAFAREILPGVRETPATTRRRSRGSPRCASSCARRSSAASSRSRRPRRATSRASPTARSTCCRRPR